MRKRNFIFCLLPFAVFFEGAVMASPESCMQQISRTEVYKNRAPYKAVNFLAEVSHEGKKYYWYDLEFSHRLGTLEIIAAEDASGVCTPISVDLGGNYVTVEQYENTLGKAVSDKFGEYFRKNR